MLIVKHKKGTDTSNGSDLAKLHNIFQIKV